MPERVPSDIITGTFYLIPPDKHFTFEFPKLCQFFYEFSQRKDYEELFENCEFDENSKSFYSPQVAFARQHLCEFFLDWINDEYYAKEDHTNEKYEEIFSEKELRLLQKMAEEYIRQFSINQNDE